MADKANETKTSQTGPKMPAPAAAVKTSAAAPVKVAAKAVELKQEPAKAAPKSSAAQPARKPARVRKAKAKPARPAAAAITKPAAAAAKAIETGVTNMATQTTTKAIETNQAAAEQIKTTMNDVNARAKTAMEKSTKIVEELAELTRGNVEAMVASSRVAAKGFESLSQGAAEYGRKSFEGATQAFRNFSEVKSATDFFKLQGDFARSAFDSAVAESARVSESVLKLAGDVAEPLTSRYSVAAERVKTLAA